MLTHRQQTAIVDIFERELDTGEIKDELKTHSVLLCMVNRESEDILDIVIIDPSYSVFSWHLSNNYMNASLDEIRVDYPNLGKIEPPKSAFKIYVPGSENIGFGKNKFRDCVDIAVKIAFYINSPEVFDEVVTESFDDSLLASASASSEVPQMKLKSSDFKNIENFLPIKLVFRTDKPNYWFEFADSPVRLRESSDPKISFKFYNLCCEINSLINDFRIVAKINHEFDRSIEEFLESLTEAYDSRYFPVLLGIESDLRNKIASKHLELARLCDDEKQNNMHLIGEKTYDEVIDE